MSTDSGLVKLFWWSLLVTPPAEGVLAVSTSTERLGNDQALGDVFCMTPLLIVSFSLYVIILLGTFFSRSMSAEQAIGTTKLLSAVVLPVYIIATAASWYLGWHYRLESVGAVVVLVLINAGWLVFVELIRIRYRDLNPGPNPAA